jgi:membrane-associated protein
MDAIFSYICQNAEYAHLIFFGLFILAGLCAPISEDLLLLAGGAIVSRCIPDQYIHLYIWMFMGCWISGWEAYWLGRYFGPKLYTLPWFSKFVTPERIAKLHAYYERFGIWTFIIGRFIPGGVRNALFITSGMGKMPFLLFTARDFVAALISTSVVFYVGYTFGENFELISAAVIRYNRIALVLIIIFIAGAFLKIKMKKTEKSPFNHDDIS